MAADGGFGPMQLIFQGGTPRTVAPLLHILDEPGYEGWEFTFSDNHWSTEDTMHSYFDNVLVPW